MIHHCSLPLISLQPLANPSINLPMKLQIHLLQVQVNSKRQIQNKINPAAAIDLNQSERHQAAMKQQRKNPDPAQIRMKRIQQMSNFSKDWKTK